MHVAFVVSVLARNGRIYDVSGVFWFDGWKKMLCPLRRSLRMCVTWSARCVSSCLGANTRAGRSTFRASDAHGGPIVEAAHTAVHAVVVVEGLSKGQGTVIVRVTTRGGCASRGSATPSHWEVKMKPGGEYNAQVSHPVLCVCAARVGDGRIVTHVRAPNLRRRRRGHTTYAPCIQITMCSMASTGRCAATAVATAIATATPRRTEVAMSARSEADERPKTRLGDV